LLVSHAVVFKNTTTQDNWDWRNIDGRSYTTHSLNQHIPQYCGSCEYSKVPVAVLFGTKVKFLVLTTLFIHLSVKGWAHGALSSLADRIQVARNATGDEINLSIQYILNCATHQAGSCHGGSHTGVFEFVKEKGFVPYDTCQPYLACSSESTEGFCKYVDTSCTAVNTCKTCDTFGGMVRDIMSTLCHCPKIACIYTLLFHIVGRPMHGD
jgi:cathepsin X